MKEIEMICFQIISHAGSAKSDYIEAMKSAKKGDYVRANDFMKSGYEEYKKAHEVHSNLITMEAKGGKVESSLLLIHAEDQISSAEVIKIVASENIDLLKKINNEEK